MDIDRVIFLGKLVLKNVLLRCGYYKVCCKNVNIFVFFFCNGGFLMNNESVL